MKKCPFCSCQSLWPRRAAPRRCLELPPGLGSGIVGLLLILDNAPKAPWDLGVVAQVPTCCQASEFDSARVCQLFLAVFEGRAEKVGIESVRGVDSRGSCMHNPLLGGLRRDLFLSGTSFLPKIAPGFETGRPVRMPLSPSRPRTYWFGRLMFETTTSQGDQPRKTCRPSSGPAQGHNLFARIDFQEGSVPSAPC